jgi:N-acetyl-anhydromuramyl-L-alanine amidase AmpD
MALTIPFVQARNYTPANRTKVDLIVIHDMEAPEKPDTAESVAKWFAGPTAPQASAHYCVDDDSIVMCVREKDVAWHAPGANSNGIGLEHAGYASQGAADWADPYSEAMLNISALLVRDICTRWQIPMNYVDAAGLLARQRGITTHLQVTNAFRQGDHTDPGPNFPMTHYIELVRGAQPETKDNRPVVNAPVVGIIAHPTWNGGYIEIGADGGVFSWGAPNFGSMGAVKLNSPVVGGAPSPSGQGYWLVAGDGGVFAFGDAGSFGSMGGKPLNKPIVGICPTASGAGYWLVASDGGLFSFGDASYKGTVQYSG